MIRFAGLTAGALNAALPAALATALPAALPLAGGVQTFATSAVPFILEPTGTMGNNGAFTRGTSVVNTYANAWSYFAAGAIQAGSAAGWYFTQSTSGTAGTVFNNTYVSGTPAIPSAPTAFASTGPGAYAGVTAFVFGPSLTLPANALGPNGVLRQNSLWSCVNNANSKFGAYRLGGVNLLNLAPVSAASMQAPHWLYNRGVASNIVFGNGSFTGSGTQSVVAIPTAIDTSQAQTLTYRFNITVPTDYMVLEGYLIEVLYG